MCPEVICTENVLGEKENSVVTIVVSSAPEPTRAKTTLRVEEEKPKREGMGSSCCSNCFLIF